MKLSEIKNKIVGFFKNCFQTQKKGYEAEELTQENTKYECNNCEDNSCECTPIKDKE